MSGIVGIFDLARSGGSLGTLLILLEELAIQRQIHVARKVHVVLVSDAKQLMDGVPPEGASASKGTRYPPSENVAAMTAVARAMTGITGCHACFDRTALAEVTELIQSGWILWPDPERLIRDGYSYDSTAVIREFQARTGNIPRLSVNAARLAWAKRYIDTKAHGKLAVAAHLKNNPEAAGQSNADLTSWFAFISGQERGAHFFLVGDDATNTKFRSLPNVTVVQDDGVTIDGHLALIQVAGLFMGMMSGPANMALFGKNPYVIFKNPNHHVREMVAELGDKDRYSFALANQRVLRMWDTTENLVEGYQSVFKQAFA